MIELRWVWNDLSQGGPTIGSINIGNGPCDTRYQKLQYRTRGMEHVTAKDCNYIRPTYSPWKDVPHSGEVV